jgi:hypothetical protein
MVFFFTSSEGHVIYMGKDKHENEDLIKFGLPEDVWFHVDGLSSAHVYLRVEKGQSVESASQKAIEECAILTKANSIQGCKQGECWITYTPWANLKKTSDMEEGAIGFHDNKKCQRIKVGKNNPIVNALNRTKKEAHPDLFALQSERQAEIQAKKKAEKKAQHEAEIAAAREREEAAKLKRYEGTGEINSIFDSGGRTLDGTVDESAAQDFEDDFM